MKYPVKKEFTAYKIRLNREQLDLLFGKGVDFRNATNESLFRRLRKLNGVIDVWFNLDELFDNDLGISIRIDADKDTEKLWAKIDLVVDKFIKIGYNED